jgi:RPA family protein
VQDTLEEKLCAIGCESGNVEGQWRSIKECVLDTISDLVEKVDKRARKPWITQEMISKIDERKKLKNVSIVENRTNCRMMRKKLKEATENAKSNILRTYVTRLWHMKEQDVMT